MRILFILALLISFSVTRAQTSKDTTVEVIEKVEVEASVDANLWRQHLVKELTPVIEKAASKGVKAGTYTVIVRFLVERDGSISDARATNNPGHGFAKAAENVIRSGPKWTPGMQNGRPVRSYHTQPITFSIANE
ncbi:MAG: energy transducer TonB [Flavisolibacter sp.]